MHCLTVLGVLQVCCMLTTLTYTSSTTTTPPQASATQPSHLAVSTIAHISPPLPLSPPPTHTLAHIPPSLKLALWPYRPYAEKTKWKDVEQPVGWMRDLFLKYVPPTIFEMKKAYSPVTPLNAMNYVTTLVNILEGCLKPENLNNKADQPMFEMMFAFAMIWAFGGALCEKDGISYR